MAIDQPGQPVHYRVTMAMCSHLSPSCPWHLTEQSDGLSHYEYLPKHTSSASGSASSWWMVDQANDKTLVNKQLFTMSMHIQFTHEFHSRASSGRLGGVLDARPCSHESNEQKELGAAIVFVKAVVDVWVMSLCHGCSVPMTNLACNVDRLLRARTNTLGSPVRTSGMVKRTNCFCHLLYSLVCLLIWVLVTISGRTYKINKVAVQQPIGPAYRTAHPWADYIANIQFSKRWDNFVSVQMRSRPNQNGEMTASHWQS